MTLEWSPLAMERAREIVEHIASDKPSAAESWLDGLMGVVGRLPDHPLSGRRVPELGVDRIREVMHGAYRVVYSVDERGGRITVLTVRRGSELLKRQDLLSG
ncbi:MAG: type II toxin-antitoxin system RelE/ParE family toxin [Pseudohongiellaceae bacterium]